MALEIKTIKNIPAIVEFNYEEISKEISIYSEKYKDLIVTEDNLGDMKKVRADLAKAENFIEEYRKNIKKELEQPIKVFEGQCKKLLGIVQGVEIPIKVQLDHFEDERKKAKEQDILKIIQNLIKKIGLNEKYSSQLTVTSKYLNKSSKEPDIIKDLESRGEQLLLLQTQEEQLEKLKKEKLDLIQVTIEEMNKKYDTNLKISEFNFLQEKEISDIPKTIETRANYIYQERLAKENAMKKAQEIEKQKVGSTPRTEQTPEPIQKTKTYNFTLEIKESTLEQAKLLKSFLDQHNFEYKLLNK